MYEYAISLPDGVIGGTVQCHVRARALHSMSDADRETPRNPWLLCWHCVETSAYHGESNRIFLQALFKYK